MKNQFVFYAIALLTFSFIFISCQKSTNPLQASSSAVTTTLRFNWNDTIVDWSTTTSAVCMRRIIQPEIPDTLYALVGTNDGAASSFLGSLYIGLAAPNLSIGSWSNDLEVSAIRYPTSGHETFGGSFAGSGSRLSISSIHDGMVDGTFQAVLTGFGYGVNITEGAFRNVKILDQGIRQ